MPESYDPAEYWSERLRDGSGLRQTGHWLYSERYNRWLYRAKRRALRRALGDLHPPLHALDVGSGTGWVVEQLLSWGATVDGSDIAEPALHELRERHAGVTFFQLAIGDDPVPRPDGVYELITAFDVMYHVVEDAQWRAAVDELARVLRRGGRLIVTDGFGSRDRHDARHVKFRSMARWHQAAAAAGLRPHASGPLYRWLSREPDEPGLRHVPGALRGPLEYALERIAPRSPHLRWASFVKHR